MYVMKIRGDGTLAFSTLLSGTGAQGAFGIMLDGNDIVLAGSYTQDSSISAPDFPTTPGAYQESFADQRRGGAPAQAFIAKLDGSGSRLLFSTFFGGTDYDGIRAFSLDGDGNVIISGETYSADLPVTPDAMHPCHPPVQFEFGNGLGGVFRAVLSKDGRRLLHSGFVPTPPSWQLGSQPVAVTALGDVVVRGIDGFSSGFPRFVLLREPPLRQRAGSIGCVANATHGFEGPIAPGSFVRIAGNRIGADSSFTALPGDSGRLPTNHDGRQVEIDGILAPLLSGSTHEIPSWPLSRSAAER
jgi:hypothetical protein